MQYGKIDCWSELSMTVYFGTQLHWTRPKNQTKQFWTSNTTFYFNVIRNARIFLPNGVLKVMTIKLLQVTVTTGHMLCYESELVFTCLKPI